MDYESLPNNIYYDANIINSDQSGTKPSPQLQFQDIRSTPILSYPEHYELSVVRFNLQSSNSLPIWIPNIQFGQGEDYDPNLTTYSFTLTYDFEGSNYTSGQTYVIYIPSDFSVQIPTKILNTEDLHTAYYYVKSFNTIVEMFNNALAEAFQRLKNSASYFGVDLPSQNPPFFEWNSDTSKFILNADTMAYDGKALKYINIYANTALYTLMSGFRADYYGCNIYEGKNYRFKIQSDLGLNVFVINDTYSTLQLNQEYSSGALFSPISSIVFTTTMLPVLPSNTTKPQIFNGQDTDLINSGNNNNIVSMITDFEVQDNDGYGFCSQLSYVPTAEYRFISMNSGNQKITNIDINIFFRDQYSHLHPMYLMPGCKCDIKILFRKKKL